MWKSICGHRLEERVLFLQFKDGERGQIRRCVVCVYGDCLFPSIGIPTEHRQSFPVGC